MPVPSNSKTVEPAARRRRAERAGRLAETAAAVLLTLKGYRVLATRFVARGGEIDLVVRRSGVLVFVEVKLRRSTEDARLAVGPANQRRIKAAAGSWLSLHERRSDVPMRYDIVAVAPWRIVHHRDAFR